MWREWLALVEGYVLIEIRGENTEKFFNLALNQGLTFWDTGRLSEDKVLAKLPVRHFRSLRSVARQSRCRVHILDKQGLYFWWHRLKRRPLFILGALGFTLGLYLLSTFVWVVDVLPLNELKKVTPEQILAAARASGLDRGAWKGELDVRAIEHDILLQIPELAWVGVSFQGTRARIEVVEKLFPSLEKDAGTPAHVIATQDGIISEILVLSGQGRVTVGDTVRRGDILISGIILPPQPEDTLKPGQAAPQPAEPRLVRARGIVRARVSYEAEGEALKEEVQEILTGQHTTTLLLRTPDREIILKGPKGPPYTNHRQENKIIRLPAWRNFTIPVELIIVTYFETSVERSRLTLEQAKAKAREQAIAFLGKEIPPESRLLGEKIVQVTETEDRVRVKVRLEIEQDIGRAAPLHKK